MAQYEEKELTAPVDLCLDNGRLNPDAVGWSRRPLHSCNVSGSWPRKKKWNFWLITNPDVAFCISLANVDYIGMAFGFVFDFKTLEHVPYTLVPPLGKGCDMPLTVEEDVEYRNKKLNLSFKYHDKGLHITADSPRFGGRPMAADLEISIPNGHETLNVVIPWSDKRFQFTSKQNTLPTGGRVTFGDKTYEFDPANSFACLDFGRGIWPYSTKWNWASGSGRDLEGNLIGLQFGGKWTDGTGYNENGICLNGKLFKISEDMVFEYDRKNFMAPWTIRTGVSDAVDLKITPCYDNVTNFNALVMKTQVHQVFGRFTGTVKVGNQTLVINDIIGWSEEQIALW